MTEYRYYHPAEVRYGDLDAQGHVNNAKYLTYFEQARVCYWTEVGLFSKEQSFTEIGVIIADIHIKYEEPIHWGLPIRIGVRITKIGNKSLTVDQCVVDDSGEHTYANGTVILVAYDYTAQRSLQVPDSWRQKLEAYERRNLS